MIIPSPDSTSNAAKSALLPNLYAMWSVSQDLKLGLSVNAPFGMSTDYDSNFVGRYHALKSDLTVIDIAPNMAYRINPQWSIGAAFVARKADATLSKAVDFGTIGAALKIGGSIPGDPSQEGIGSLKGSKWGYGYRLGVTFQPTETLRLGLAYHSAMNMNLSGNATYQFGPGTPSPATLQAVGFANGSATAELNLPSTTSLGIHFEVSPVLSVNGELSRTDWSTFNELRVKFSNGAADDVTAEKWRDTWFYSLGLAWKVSDAWTIRTGVAYDQSAVTDAYRTPRIPDGDRTWLSVGAGYAFNQNTSMDFAYTHIFVKDAPSQL